MTFHVVRSCRGLQKESRTGVWVGVQRKKEKRVTKDYTKSQFVVTMYDDVVRAAGFVGGEGLVLEVGADIDVGIIKIRRATKDEIGLKARVRTKRTLEVESGMRAFPLPHMTPRHSERAKRIVVAPGEVTIALPGEFTRDLRAAQETALEKMRKEGAIHAKG